MVNNNFVEDGDVQEGIRFYQRLHNIAWDLVVENGDSEFPQFTRLMSTTRKFWIDNPDATYDSVHVRLEPGKIYRITGEVPDVRYWGFSFNPAESPVSVLRDSDIKVKEDGTYEVFCSLEKYGENCLDTKGYTKGDITFRTYRYDWRQEVSMPKIEIIDGSVRPKPFPRGAIANRSVIAKNWAQKIYESSARYKERYRLMEPNKFFEISELSESKEVFRDSKKDDWVTDKAPPMGGLVDNQYIISRFQIEPRQRLIIQGKKGECRYFSVWLSNLWGESYDYRYYRCGLNDTQISFENGDVYEFVLSHDELDHPNWLDPANHREGIILLRWLLPKGEIEQPTIKLISE